MEQRISKSVMSNASVGHNLKQGDKSSELDFAVESLEKKFKDVETLLSTFCKVHKPKSASDSARFLREKDRELKGTIRDLRVIRLIISERILQYHRTIKAGKPDETIMQLTPTLQSGLADTLSWFPKRLRDAILDDVTRFLQNLPSEVNTEIHTKWTDQVAKVHAIMEDEFVHVE